MEEHGSSRWTVLPGLLVLALLTGCSSSLDTTADGRGAGAGPLATVSGATADPARTSPAGGASEESPVPGSETRAGSRQATGTSATTTGSGAAAVTGDPGPAAAGTANAPTAGRGVTATTITIGVVVIDYAGLQDVKGYNNGNPRVQAQAAADHVNRHGGMAGRKVVLEFAEFPVTSSNWAADEQAMCTTFTEDKKVFAVIAGALSQGKTFLPCLAKHRTPLISSAGGLTDDEGMAAFANYHYYSGGLTLSRLARAYANGLAAAKFFGAGSRVGLVRVDDQPYERTTAKVLRPRLAELGVRIEEEAVVSAMESLSSTASQMPSIVLRFQQRGINRVIFLDNASVGPLFAIQAASQSYYPRYGLTSASLPNAMAENVPATALAGAVGVGWLPALDVFAVDEASPTAAARTCRDLNVKAGQGDVSRTGEAQQRLYCDELFFLRTALAGTADVSTQGLLVGVESLNTRFDSATTFATRFAPGHHAGAAATRSFAFVDACRCFRYTARPTTAG